MIYAIADTHGLVWYLFQSPRLSEPAKNVFDYALANRMTIGVSAITLVEIIYLIEKSKIPTDALNLLNQKLKQKNSLFEIVPISQALAESIQKISRDQVPDMPDRIIAATSLYLNVPLISRDGKIKLSQVKTIW